MDPVSHILFGRTLHALDRRRRLGRGALAALLLGSIAPDIDVVLVPWRFDSYLRCHEMGTHSLLGAAIVAAVLALALRLRLGGARFPHLLLAAGAGVSGHLLWDLASGADLRLLFPWSDRRIGWHLVTMGDPAIVAILVFATLLRPRGGRRWAVAVLAALALVLSMKLVSRHAAEHAYLASVAREGVPPESYLIDARPSPFSWRVFDRSGQCLRASLVDAWTGEVRREVERKALGDEAVVLASERLRVVRNLRRVALFPFAWLEGEGAVQRVFWSDLTFCDTSGCVLAFGAAFDQRLAFQNEIVRIGPASQTWPVEEAPGE